MNAKPVYMEFVDFIAGGMSSAELVAFKASDETSLRVETLIRKEKNGLLTGTELDELNSYMQWAEMINLAKAKARANLSTQ